MINESRGYLYEAKAKGNEPPVTNTPGVCKWKCPICVCHLLAHLLKKIGRPLPFTQEK
jgi:hypothetical protein